MRACVWICVVCLHTNQTSQTPSLFFQHRVHRLPNKRSVCVCGRINVSLSLVPICWLVRRIVVCPDGCLFTSISESPTPASTDCDFVGTQRSSASFGWMIRFVPLPTSFPNHRPASRLCAWPGAIRRPPAVCWTASWPTPARAPWSVRTRRSGVQNNSKHIVVVVVIVAVVVLFQAFRCLVPNVDESPADVWFAVLGSLERTRCCLSIRPWLCQVCCVFVVQLSLDFLFHGPKTAHPRDLAKSLCSQTVGNTNSSMAKNPQPWCCARPRAEQTCVA